MKFQELGEFRYMRELSIIYVVRETGYSVQKSLQLTAEKLPILQTEQAIQILNDYASIREKLFPNIIFLFPTEDGAFFLPDKFKQNLRRLLRLAGKPFSFVHPNKISEDQLQAILKMKFNHQRPVFQKLLATSILGYMALRPGEVANLRKDDVDVERGILYLRETKSQEAQLSPIHEDLLVPLTNYIRYLDDHEPLFIRNSNLPWTRKDVYRAALDLCNDFGIGRVNPRTLRSTVAHYLINEGVPLNIISEVLRHKDKATAPRHYTPIFDVELVRKALNQFHPHNYEG